MAKNGIAHRTKDNVTEYVPHLVRLINDVVEYVFAQGDLFLSVAQDIQHVEAEYKKWMPSYQWRNLSKLLRDIQAEMYTEDNFDKETWQNFLRMIFDSWMYLKSDQNLEDIIVHRSGYHNCVIIFYDYIHYYSVPAAINDTVISKFADDLAVCNENFKPTYRPRNPDGTPVIVPGDDPGGDSGKTNIFIWIAVAVAAAVVGLWLLYSRRGAGTESLPDAGEELDAILG